MSIWLCDDDWDDRDGKVEVVVIYIMNFADGIQGN